MSKKYDNNEENINIESEKENDDNENIVSNLEEEIEEEKIEEKSEDLENIAEENNTEVLKLKDLLARTQADFENFKKRVQRDKDDMIFFIKTDIFKKIIPRVDDLERIIKNTKEEMKNGALYNGIVALEKSFKKDLNSLGLEQFNSIGNELDPNKHEVMTQVSGAKNIIIDEFEKGYEIGDRVLRHAKVIVGNGE